MLMAIRGAVRLRADATAVTSLEYAILAALMTVVGLAGIGAVGNAVFNTLGPVKAAISGTGAGATGGGSTGGTAGGTTGGTTTGSPSGSPPDGGDDDHRDG